MSSALQQLQDLWKSFIDAGVRRYNLRERTSTQSPSSARASKVASPAGDALPQYGSDISPDGKFVLGKRRIKASRKGRGGKRESAAQDGGESAFITLLKKTDQNSLDRQARHALTHFATVGLRNLAQDENACCVDDG